MQDAVRPAPTEQPEVFRSTARARIRLRALFVLFYVQSLWEMAMGYLPFFLANALAALKHKSMHAREVRGLRGWLGWLRDEARRSARRLCARLGQLLATLRRAAWRIARAHFHTFGCALRAGARRVLRFLGRPVKWRRRVHAALRQRAFDKIVVLGGRKSIGASLFSELQWQFSRALPEPYMIGLMIRAALLIPDLARARGLAQELLRLYPENFADHQQAAIQFFISGHYDDAKAVWTEIEERREAAIRRERLHLHNMRLLGPSWLLAIGHIAHIDIYLKRKILSGRAGQRTVMVVPWHIKISNRALLECWRPYVEILEPGAPLGLDIHAVELLQDEFWSLRLGPRNVHMFSHAGAIVQREWDQRGLGPLLRLNDSQERIGAEELSKVGIDPKRWFVCLHVREPGFHKSWHKSHPGTRNANVITYLRAARSIVERGGQVIRMGDPSMKRLPSIEGVFDYAHSAIKSEFMDVYLCAKARLFIGTNSGLGLVPPIFGVPCALTNWSPIALPQWYTKDRFIPKLIYSRKLGRHLSFEEMFSSAAGWQQFERYFEEAGLDVIDNTPEEIDELVCEMLDLEEGREPETDVERGALSLLTGLATSYGSYIGAKIGKKFLKRWGDLYTT